MAESDATRQQEEIDALHAIYADDFLENAEQRAWKGAASLREFTLRVQHPVTYLATKFMLHLHVILPKGYPSRAIPTVRVTKPISGLSQQDAERINASLREETINLKGSEMLFQLVTACQEWLSNAFPEAKYAPAKGSLAMEMSNRELQMEKDKRLQEEGAALVQQKREAEEAASIALDFKHTAERKQAKQRIEKHRNRESIVLVEDQWATDQEWTEKFDDAIIVDDREPFHSVLLSRPRKVPLGVVYDAKPVNDESFPPTMDLLVVSFDSLHYADKRVWPKLHGLLEDVQLLKGISHPHLQTIYGCKLSPRIGKRCPRLLILTEPSPVLSLHDLLEACGSLTADKVVDYFQQALSGLAKLHGHSVLHQYITTRHIGLYPTGLEHPKHCIKLTESSYFSCIAGLNRSNSFGLEIESAPPWPESWLSESMVRSPLLHSQSRDLFHMAIVTLEMCCGLDVTRSSATVKSVVGAKAGCVETMLGTKTHTSCNDILESLRTNASHLVNNRTMVQVPELAKPLNHRYSLASAPPEVSSLPTRAQQGSRYGNDWEELEFLGSGGFGEVVKARNKLDSRIYAVKKIRLRASDNDAKIFREVNALARLSHRCIVRYFTTWIEILERGESPSPSNTESGDLSELSIDDTIRTNSRDIDIFQVDLNDLTTSKAQQDSFPGIYFADNSNDEPYSSSSEDTEDSFHVAAPIKRTRIPASTLYIQMEYVENLTLKERVANGLDEDEAWRLFHQLLDALVHMASLGIVGGLLSSLDQRLIITKQLHRDIKLGNIFIDAKGDCKIGDFGLATSHMATLENSAAPHALRSVDSDLTMDVGTRLYVAPEILARGSRGGPRNHSKADMYSLGIVFFEMNFTFSTGAERIRVIENLRLDGEDFPAAWEAHRSRQRKIISTLLQHDVTLRPSALELSQSPLLPSRIEDESLQGAIRLMSQPESPHYSTVVSLLFDQNPRFSRSLLYNTEFQQKEYATLDEIVEASVRNIFRAHGAVAVQPPILLPATKGQLADTTSVYLLDRQGDLLTLPKNGLTPLARLAAIAKYSRIKRFHISHAYHAIPTGGHPTSMKVAVFDVITGSLTDGADAALAECMLVTSQIMERFPGFDSPPYEFRLFHPQITTYILSRIDNAIQSEFKEILTRSKTSFAQKRVALLHLGLARALIDDIEILMTPVEMDRLQSQLDKLSADECSLLTDAMEDIKRLIQLLSSLSFKRRIVIQLLNLNQAQARDGAAFEVAKGTRRTDVLAACGRYDYLLKDFSIDREALPALRCVAVQIAFDKITSTLANFQSTNVPSLIKEQKSFGFWSPRRCDVYIISHQPGQLQERLQIAEALWSHEISADIMYEAGLDEGVEAIHEQCMKEGILFTVVPRPRSSRAHVPSLKVTSTLTRSEHEVSRAELVSFLKQRLMEQKRMDVNTSGVSSDRLSTNAPREPAAVDGVHFVLPPERKQLKHNKKLLRDKAFEIANQVHDAFTSRVPVIAVQVSAESLAAMTQNTAWLDDDDPEALKSVIAAFPPPTAYVTQIREAITKRKEEGSRFVLILSLRDDRLYLLDLL